LAVIILAAAPAMATCDSGVFNPVTDVAWNGIFPIRVGGVKVASNSSAPDGDKGTVNPICTCTTTTGTYLGTEIGFWDIAYMAEVVDDPGCSPTLGASLGLNDGFHQGMNSKTVDAPHTFKQVHWLMFPAFRILGMLTDLKCLQSGDLAFGSMSEVDPSHASDFLAALKDPKVFLFANPVADIACSAKNAIAQVPGNFFPSVYDSLFWCLWDNIYPLSGHSGSPHALTAASQIVGRQIYLFSEYGGILDYTSNSCQGQPNFLMKSSQWRFQIAKPVKTATPFWPGQSELIWGAGKTLPYKDKNFLYVLFQKKKCCQKLLGAN